MSVKNLPFSRKIKTFLSDLTKVLKTPEEPSLSSKCYAAVEFVLCTFGCVKPEHILVEDHGWPVKRHYTMSGEKYSISHLTFDLYFIEDSESILVVIWFNSLSYKVIAFNKYWVPFGQYDDEKLNMEKMDLIDKRMFKYTQKIRPNKPSLVQSFEKKYISTTICSKEEYSFQEKVQGGIYQRIVAVDKDTNPISHNMPIFYRLYRTVLSILDDQCTDIPDLKRNKELKPKNKYEGELIKILFRDHTFHINLVEGLLCYFLNIRVARFDRFNSKLYKHLGGWAIPFSHVPSFISDSYNIHVDSIKVDSLSHFIKEILLRSLTKKLKSEARKSRKRSRRSRDSSSSDSSL